MSATRALKRQLDEVRDAIAANIRKLEGISAKHRAKIDGDIKKREDYDRQAASYVQGDDFVRQDRGRNTKTTTFDPETGRPISEAGVIREDFGSTDRGDNATDIGGTGRDSDDGGHLGGHRFFGDTTDVGMIPQDSNLNRGAWKKMENEWADWAKKGYEVRYDVDIVPGPDGRPAALDVAYTVVDPNTGRVARSVDTSFNNDPGQTFDRVYASDMPTIK